MKIARIGLAPPNTVEGVKIIGTSTLIWMGEGLIGLQRSKVDLMRSRFEWMGVWKCVVIELEENIVELGS